MNTDVIVALIAFVGTAIGSVCGILVANRLSNYRISLLEKKVDEHNQVIRRTFVLEEQMKVTNHRLTDLEKGE